VEDHLVEESVEGSELLVDLGRRAVSDSVRTSSSLVVSAPSSGPRSAIAARTASRSS